MASKIDQLLDYSLESGSSDLHLSVGAIPMVRINGTMRKLNMPMLSKEDMEAITREVMNDDQLRRFQERKEIDFSRELEGKGRFRVNFFRQIRGTAGVFRTIPTVIKGFDELDVPPVLAKLAMKDRGLILLTGPTGSGKSTTLAAMVDHINEHREAHIITIEDPVEYYHESKNCLINQRELGISTDSFANALRSALREDPDVILVGEMRDLETIQLALTAAETGHLVMSTLHTSSASKTIDRIIDIFPVAQKGQVRSMLSESLVAVIAQKLLKTKDDKGRVPGCEIMIANSAVRNLIREDKIYQIPSVIQAGGVDGMQTLDQDLQRLVSQGKITRASAAQIADNPKLFEQGIL
ncbi:MAG: type IV pilus twitching motility protein PilT [Candidatus Marinimicrobia bacterium]|nr:type IV pilus twitching motility protein PilT [Candidatus Neomarinimicrobiota bacterium]